ncbi:MAG: hypothetical protein ACRDC6_19045 [Shewanella sp.]|uniref:hypothetical protein n=1 Tax=Aeromonas veronii TaxID=654 RepID=UPI003D235CF4
MNKKEKVASQNGTTHTKQGDTDTQSIGIATKLELVALHLLENGTQGISALSAFAKLHDLNPRNSISDLRKHHNITISDEFFSHQHAGGDVVHFKRYWLQDRDEASKVVELINVKCQQRGAMPLSEKQIVRYLTLFPIKSSHQPAA